MNELEKILNEKKTENVRHAHIMGLISHEKTSKKVSQYTLDDKYINTFNSIREAARKVYNKESANVLIWKCLNNKLASYKGYKWEYC